MSDIKRDGLNCKTKDGKCAERQQGSYGACRLCEFSIMTRPIQIELTMRDYQFLQEQCAIDMKFTVEAAVAELVKQGIKSLKRHVKEK